MDDSKTLHDNISAAIATVLRGITVPATIDKEDLFQSAYLHILEVLTRGHFNPDHPSAFNYLCKVARSSIMTLLPREARYLDSHPQAASLPEIVGELDESGRVEKDETLKELAAIRAELSPADREILSLYYDEELSGRECAARLGYSHKTFFANLERIHEILGSKLEKKGMM